MYKNWDPSDANNYRPVLLLSWVGKVFERIIFKNVFNYFREHLIISIHQSGLQPGDSTVNHSAIDKNIGWEIYKEDERDKNYCYFI